MEVDLRKEYQPHRENKEQQLSASTSPENPLQLFSEWFNDALKSSQLTDLRDGKGRSVEVELYEPHAMVLSTVTSNHRPRSRVVLLREFTDNGLVFYTNYKSDKGKEMATQNYAAVNFYWPSIDRQVRIEGRIEKTSLERSQRYFDSRPPASRIAAAASQQSQILPRREDLINEINRHAEPPPCPEHWGGYILIPDFFEFWLGRRNRLHERLAYRLKKEEAGLWKKHLLYP